MTTPCIEEVGIIETEKEHGHLQGEVCNRLGCKGVIDEHEKDGCSCHISPPCSNCIRDAHYCPECEWSGEEEQNEHYKKMKQYYKDNPPKEMKVKTLADLDNNKIDYIRTFTGYYGYVYEGVFPEGTTLDEVKKEIGWYEYFGGIVYKFGNGKFKIKKYTD